METTNDNINIVPRQEAEIEAATAATRIKDMWLDFQIKKSRNGTFAAFDDYRQSLGGRGIWGTKIFFRALKELNFLRDCDENEESSGRYCPTEYAIGRYGDMFRWDDEDKIWGLSEQHLDDFEDRIFPHLLSTARKLERMFNEEKKERARARYIAKKALEKTLAPVNTGENLI